MKTILRYDLTYRNDFGDIYSADADEDADGEWVRYADVAHLIAPSQPAPVVTEEMARIVLAKYFGTNYNQTNMAVSDMRAALSAALGGVEGGCDRELPLLRGLLARVRSDKLMPAEFFKIAVIQEANRIAKELPSPPVGEGKS